MLRRLLPRQESFFQLFQHAADKLVLAATDFSHMLEDLDKQQYYVDVIAKHEKDADRIAHTNFALLHKTFITPFDRHDIHQLTSALDDVIDLIHRIAQRFPFYELKAVPEELVQLARLSAETAAQLKKAIYCLHSLKNSDEIFGFCEEINRLENKAHQIALAGEKKLFIEETDFKHFYKLKEIYEFTKRVINHCQDISNMLKGIVLEYS